MSGLSWLRSALVLLFLLSGILHLVLPGPYLAIMPRYLPAPGLLVAISGCAEIAGGLGLLWPSTRRLAGWGLLLLLLAIFPANIEMLRLYRARGVSWWGETLLWLRLPVQALLAWGVWKVSGPHPSRGDRPAGGDIKFEAQ